MHITKIELENIKSHTESSYSFSMGSTAISGENGAGKTTLIEAVAWTLFDVLDYKKDDFVRRGAKKGSARVTFESSLDEREYTVYRDTGTGYYVFDPRLQLRIADKKEEVTRFLWQHLGVDAGTDLESLFKHAIGVPQGTLTAIFLATAAEKKRTFDTLLKVEEYRRSADELLKTQRFVENRISAVRENIARNEGELTSFDEILASLKSAESDLERLTGVAETTAAETAEISALVRQMDQLERDFNAAAKELDASRSEHERAKVLLDHSEKELARSREAVERLEKVRPIAGQHKAALGRIKELERERTERDKLRAGQTKIETAEAAVKAEERHTRTALTEAQAAHKEIERLRPLAAKQETAEAEMQRLRDELSKAKAAMNQAERLEKDLERLRDEFLRSKAAVAAAEEKAIAASMLERAEARDAEIVGELATFRAQLERDEAFQREIKNGLCPILSQKCLNLAEGETLESFVSSQFDELRTKIGVLSTERVGVASELTKAREAQTFAARLDSLRERAKEIEEEGRRLRSERDALNGVLEAGAKIEVQIDAARTELDGFENAKARLKVLEERSGRDAELREAITNIESNLERLSADRQIVLEGLEKYVDLDPQWDLAIGSRDETEAAYSEFLSLETMAKALPERTAAFETSREASSVAEKNVGDGEVRYKAAADVYDSEKHLSARATLANLQTRGAEIAIRIESATRQRDGFRSEIERLSAIRESMAAELTEKVRLEKLAETTVFIRDTLKEAAPLVARNYVYHVSLEAAQLFREITGNAERTLRWADDYSIVLEEGGHERPFQSFSGGEQMAAALSVRLALLKQLSDIRIAFFDEPTTNMDAERRENLAMQIGQIRHFDQLFVISHDDTFDSYMDHEMRVER